MPRFGEAGGGVGVDDGGAGVTVGGVGGGVGSPASQGVERIVVCQRNEHHGQRLADG